MGQGNRTGVIGEGGQRMGLVKTRRLAAMQKQQRAKAGMKALPPKQARVKGVKHRRGLG